MTDGVGRECVVSRQWSVVTLLVIGAARIARRYRPAGAGLVYRLHIAPLSPRDLEAVPLRLECRSPLDRKGIRLHLDAVGPPLMVIARGADDGLDIHRGGVNVIEHREQQLADDA